MVSFRIVIRSTSLPLVSPGVGISPRPAVAKALADRQGRRKHTIIIGYP